jgi:hypothetical protein
MNYQEEIEKVVEAVYKRIENDPLWENWLRQEIGNLLTTHSAHLVERIDALKVEPIPELEGSDGHLMSHNQALDQAIDIVKITK